MNRKRAFRAFIISYGIFSVALVIIAITCLGIAYPYITNSIHDVANPTVQYYVLSQENCHFYIKFETLDAFMANNAINVTVIAEPINSDKIQSIRLTLNGATNYFPRTNTANETFMDLFNDWQSMNENILILTKDSKSESIVYDNQTYYRFTGELTGLTYANAGTYDVFVQFEPLHGTAYGYGVPPNNTTQNNPFILRQAITVSAAENMLQTKTNNITTGLGWISVSVPILLAGLVGLIEFLKFYFFEKKQPFACVSGT